MNFVFGGIIDKDTLVTEYEFLPDLPPEHQFVYETLDIGSQQFSPLAHSNLDILCRYNDSISDPQFLGHADHHPLGVRVNQRSMAWSSDNISNFVLVDCELTCIGSKAIHDCFVGVHAYGTVHHETENANTARTLAGSLTAIPSVTTCGVADTLGVGYWMDNDGNPEGSEWTAKSALGAMGICILRHPAVAPKTSFNWFTFIDVAPIQWWSPFLRADAFRYPRNNLNFPDGDIASYFLMSNGYHVYDQMNMAVDYTRYGWAPPPSHADIAAAGTPETDLLVSTGPFDLGPGQRIHFTYAIVAGDNVHVNPTDFADLWDPYHPDIYYNSLDFTELMTNARWAKWVYDNPGVDTDGDGYFGKFRVCDGDTNWYEGDGVPDFRADIPPPAPKLRIISSNGSLTLRWNGYYSENAIDPFTKVKDFEGYRVYSGLDDRETSMSTLISWDYQDYTRLFLKEKPNHTFVWTTNDLPFTIDSLRVLYGDSFNPLTYTKDNPLHIADTIYSFQAVDYNLSSLIPEGVHKVYPEARNPGADSTQWLPDDLTGEHGGKLPKYYEYEYTLNNVLPTIANYVSVTAFDFGFAKGNIPAKESSKRENVTVAYAQTSADSVVTNNLNVYVYPNPYLMNKDYHAMGYENHDNTQIPSRSHRINFGNLPPKCRISIFSLDGDLIRSWEHDYGPSDPQAMHDAWDLITRNTMLPVAGLYYWVVEAPGRTQIGKLVIVE